MSAAATMLSEHEYDSETFRGLEGAGVERSGLALYDCTFDGCDLSGARLTDCRFVHCTFVNCDLGLAELTDSSFRGASFEDCKLIGVTWSLLRSDPGLPPEIDFFRCALDFGDFSDLDLSQRRFHGCRLHDATFSRTKLVDADLQGSDLAGARFEGCDLGRADFRGASNYQLDPRNNRVVGARFSLPEALGLLAAFEIELS